MNKKEQFEKMDIQKINKLISLSWLCVSSGMDATNQLDEYMSKFGFRGLFYQDLRAIRRDYEIYAKKIRGSIEETQTRDYFQDFDSFNAMINKWAGVDKKEYLSYLLKDEETRDILKELMKL